jgi:DHA1 family bicyclomycin/chloramphenicol resistance-like MFS transporter
VYRLWRGEHRTGSPTRGIDRIAFAPSPSPVRRIRLVLILGWLSALAPLSIDLYLPGLPELTRDLDASASEGQLTLTACLGGLALGQLVAGPLSDRFGRRRPLLVGLAVYCAASFLCAVAPSVYVLVGLRLVQGFAGAAGIVVARAIVRDVSSGAAAARLFSILMLVLGLAPILAPIVGGALLELTSWRGLFVTLTIVALALFLSTAAGLEETLPAGRRRADRLLETRRTFASLARDRTFLGYTLAGGFSFGSMFAYIAGSPFVVQEIYGVSPQLYGAIFGMNALGIIICSQINGALVGRLGPRRLLGIGIGLGASGGCAVLGAVAAGAGLAGILPCLFVSVASLGFVVPNATALALTDYPHIAGSAAALIGALQFLFGAAAAPLVGVAGSGSALPMAVLMAAFGVGALGALRLSITEPYSRRLPPAQLQ